MPYRESWEYGLLKKCFCETPYFAGSDLDWWRSTLALATPLWWSMPLILMIWSIEMFDVSMMLQNYVNTKASNAMQCPLILMISMMLWDVQYIILASSTQNCPVLACFKKYMPHTYINDASDVPTYCGLQRICARKMRNKLGGDHFTKNDTNTDINLNDMKHCQGYIEENGGRRPGHLVLYPIEVVS